MDITSGHRDQPALTYYRDDERVELSVRTMLNWRAKFANFYRDYLTPEPGDVLAVTLTEHWLAVPLIAAAGDVGLSVCLGANQQAIATVCGIADANVDSGGDFFVCSAAILGEPLPTAAPVGTEDLLAAVRIQPDQFPGELCRFPQLLRPGDVPIDAETVLSCVAPDLRGADHVLIDDHAADRTTAITTASFLGIALGNHVVWAYSYGGDLDQLANAERCDAIVRLAG